MKPFYEKAISMQSLEAAQQRLKERVYRKVADMTCEVSVTEEPIPFEERLGLTYSAVAAGQKWGELFDCAWFHFVGKAPDCCVGEKLVLRLDINGEGCLYDKDGVPVRGITNISSEFDKSLGAPGKRVVPFCESSKGGETVDLWVDAGCNDLFGNYRNGTLETAEIAACREDIRSVYYDYWVLFDLLKTLDSDSARYCGVLYALDSVAKILNTYSAEEMAACKKILARELKRKSGDGGLTFYATGHAHLDLAWLWPIRESKRKAARTFATAAELLGRYPSYIFGASQPQQFLWVKQNHPALYQKIKRLVAEGRIEPQGAMWVEPDLNVTGGESLVRQVLYGKKFFREEFDKEITTAHIPDVFGFSGALPQILKKSGVDNLLTIKMSWNKFNEFPYHTFVWQGIDGSDVLVHMPPEGSYNSAAAPRSVAFSEKNYKEKGKCDKAVMLYGIGDGGGGPGPEHLERLERIRDLNGISRVVSSTTADFFELIKKDRAKLATYRGEMYLEKHQGTYTSQARNKYYNRRLERALKDAEYFLTAAYKLCGAEYPKEELNTIWQEVLLYQFHDILPGSSIKRVYDESVARYRILEKQVAELTQGAIAVLGGGELFNASSVTRKEAVKVGDDWYEETFLPYSGPQTKTPANGSGISAKSGVLETKTLRAEFDANGGVKRLFDKINKRETLRGASALRVYEDNGDAWDMEEGYLSRPRGEFKLKEHKSYTDGPFAVREQTLVYGDSVLYQTIRLSDTEGILRFDCKIDYREHAKFLKAEFDTAVVTDTVNCGTQFGNIKRSTKNNNPYECAQDEICAQRYLDLSEGDYGLAVLSDCKYGYNAKGSSVKLSLLRSTSHPGKDADQGKHSFSYALYPHAQNFEQSQTAELASVYGSKLRECSAAGLFTFFSKSCIIESIKRAESGDGIVVRICEEKGLHSSFSLSPNFDFKCCKLITADEKEKSVLAAKNLKDCAVSPFDIVTLLFQ